MRGRLVFGSRDVAFGCLVLGGGRARAGAAAALEGAASRVRGAVGGWCG